MYTHLLNVLSSHTYHQSCLYSHYWSCTTPGCGYTCGTQPELAIHLLSHVEAAAPDIVDEVCSAS